MTPLNRKKQRGYVAVGLIHNKETGLKKKQITTMEM